MIPLKYIGICFLLLFLSSKATAQNKAPDLSKLSYDELYDLYFENENNPQIQIVYNNAYMAKATKENNSIRKTLGNYHKALLYYKSDHKKAISYLDSVIKYSKNTGDKFFPAAAYCEKADLLKKSFKFKEAMDNYKLAEKIALQTNIDYYYVVRDYIGITKSEDLGEFHEALAIYKESYNYYKTKEYRTAKYSGNFQGTIFGLADCYKSLNDTDSTTYYNKLGYKESKATNNMPFLYIFILNEGANQILKKNYITALDSINKSLPYLIKYKDNANVLASYFYLGQVYDGLGKKEEAVKNFLKVDSLYTKNIEITNEFVAGYPYLISYYKKKGDKENQLKYISKYMSIDSILQKKYRNLNKLLHVEYDIPRLMSEKQSLIDSLEKDNKKSYLGIGFLTLTIITVSGFGFYQFRLKKRYLSRFEHIMEQMHLTKNQEYEKDTVKNIKGDSLKSNEIGIAEELVNEILAKLDQFEKNKGFLKSDLTVQFLSTLFETNSKYLSKIVNTYRSKTFVQYVNDLRIEHAVENLTQKSKFRKYTIQALALEFGFNNAESFSAAFYKKLGIKPAFFIKELEESLKVK